MIRALLGLNRDVAEDKRMETSDPYEQQLLAVFESCDDYCQNTLSCNGLYQLCGKLQLEDHYHKLLKCILGESQKRRVTFLEFKDGLLKLLNSAECEERNSRALSPAREISPKYVFGKKKYGRRSRPESIGNDNQTVDNADDVYQEIHSCSTDNDSESEESMPKKRKTRSFKRKDIREQQRIDGESKSQQSILSPAPGTLSEEECLITAWSNVSGGIRNSLNKDELVSVFQCVGLESGLEEAAQSVFEKLEVEENGSITLQDLLEFIRSGVSWSKDMRNQELETETCQKGANFDYFGASVGCVMGSYLLEQWEAAGVPCASHLLHKLDFSETQQIDITTLIALISDELKILNDDKSRSTLDPSSTLILAISVLQNIQVQSLKTLMEHMNAEKEKLRSDVIEANQRALLLAQEIDEHHSKLEHSAQQQVKTLELRHAEKIRELTMQLKSEQDAQANHASQLESKVSSLEEERNKCKVIILQLEHENRTLEQEHRVVMNQLSAVQLVKEKLEADLESLSNLQIKVTEMEATVSNNEMMSLLERIHVLESENTNLRDRNDELSTEVEELSAKLLNTSIKKRSSPVNFPCISADESMDETNLASVGTKRRGKSFELAESVEDSGGEEESPRLGKVRKCSLVKDFASATCSLEELQIHGIDLVENLEDGPPERASASVAPEEVRFDEKRTRRNLSFSQELQQVLEEKINGSNEVDEKMKLSEDSLIRCNESGSTELLNTFKGKDTHCEGCSKMEEKIIECQEEAKKSRAETEAISERCKELETSLELMKEEYEKTEDYWSGKLEEERAFFEEEQKIIDKKYSKLVDKIIEYEDMLGAEREHRQRLETIDEKDGFEKQVMDLEQECLELRSRFTEALKEKESEIEKLKEEIRRSKMPRDLHDASVQVIESFEDDAKGMESQTQTTGENVGRKSKIYSRRSFTFSSGDRKPRFCAYCRNNQASREYIDLRGLHDSKKQLEREMEILINERNLVYKEVVDKRRELNSYVFNGGSVSSKFNEMEDKCHSLMETLRHQQKQTEEILKNTWKQHKTEVKDLKSVLKMTEEKLKRQTEVIQEQLNKLARTDLLVKDLFVENAYLVSSVQKLEQQCQPVKIEDATL